MWKLDIKEVERMVGRLLIDVQVKGKWVVLYFSSPGMIVKFRQW